MKKLVLISSIMVALGFLSMHAKPTYAEEKNPLPYCWDVEEHLKGMKACLATEGIECAQFEAKLTTVLGNSPYCRMEILQISSAPNHTKATLRGFHYSGETSFLATFISDKIVEFKFDISDPLEFTANKSLRVEYIKNNILEEQRTVQFTQITTAETSQIPFLKDLVKFYPGVKNKFVGIPGGTKGDAPLISCQEVYAKLDTMRECPADKGPQECVGFDVTLMGTEQGCYFQGATNDLPTDKETNDVIMVAKTDGTKGTFVKETKTALNTISFSTVIQDVTKWDEYDHFLFNRLFTSPPLNIEYRIYFNTLNCMTPEDCPGSMTDIDKTPPDTAPGGEGGVVPGDGDVAGVGGDGSGVGGLRGGTRPPSSDVADSNNSTGGGLSGCMNLGPNVPYHFGFGWLPLIGLLLALFRFVHRPT